MHDVEDCISFLVGKAAQQVTQRARGKLAPYGVTPTQYAVLKVLWSQDGQTGAAISARLSIDSATLTGVIDRLETAGLIERKKAERDRRIYRLFLTERGRSLRRPLDKAMDQPNAEADNVTGAHTAVLRQSLRRLGNADAWQRL